MHDDSVENDGRGIERGVTDGSDPTSGTVENHFDRRAFIKGMTVATGTGVIGSGALSEPVSADSNETGSDWKPKTVPYGMETPWYEDVSPGDAHTEYPRPQLVRDDWQPLNGLWEFAAASAGESPPIGDELDERILVPFPPESSLSGIQRHEERMWYRTTVSVPNGWLVPTAHSGNGLHNTSNAQRLLLHFERIDWEATIYVNGEQVNTHKGGYDSITIDITDFLTDDGEQEIVVGVYDPTENGTQPIGKQETVVDEDIFFTPSSGIWDTVWMEPVRETHIEDLDMTPNLERDTLELTVSAPDGTTVTATAYDDDTVVGSATGLANEQLDLPVSDPHLWSPNDPHLYDLDVELHHSNENRDENGNGNESNSGPVDSVASYFGMRSLGTKHIKGVLRPTLNGEFLFQNGIYDQGYWPDGLYTPPVDEARRFDLQLAKQLGYNTYRKHIKIPSKRWYYWADKLGLLVWQDIPNQPLGQPDANEAAREQFRAELREMITENNNHPSLAVWVPVNEGWGHGKTNYDRIRSTTRFVEELDDERLINSLSGIDTMFETGEIGGDMIDFHNYGRVTPLPEPTDEQVSVVGESAAGWTPIDGHQWDGGTPSGDTPSDLVQNLITRAENNSQYMVDDGFSAAINLQVTDTEFHYQGVVTYDRAVFKPELVDGAIERIRTANEALIERSKRIEQGPYLSIEAPLSYSLDETSFEIVGTITNPAREESGAFDLSNAQLSVAQSPDWMELTAKTPSTFDTVPEGTTASTHWKYTPPSDSDSDSDERPAPGAYAVTVKAAFDGENESTVLRSTHGFEIEPAEPQIVGSWPFDDGSGDTATDTVGSNDGTLIGNPAWTEGVIETTLRFDGTDDYVDTGASVLDTTEDYSVAAWVTLDDLSGFQTAVSQAMGDSTAFFLQYIGNERQFSFSFPNSRAVGGPTVETDRWYHIAAVHDTYEQRAKLYIDGERATTIDRAPTESSDTLFIGRATVGGNAVDFWNGSIDHVHAYQSSLDDREVRDLYESEKASSE